MVRCQGGRGGLGRTLTGKGQRSREIEIEIERECVCVCVCVRERAIEKTRTNDEESQVQCVRVVVRLMNLTDVVPCKELIVPGQRMKTPLLFTYSRTYE